MSTPMDTINKLISGLSVKSLIGDLIAGAANGYLIVQFGLGEAAITGSFFQAAFIGIGAYGGTKIISRIVNMLFASKSDRASMKLLDFNLLNWAFAGALNAFVFLGLRPFFDEGRVASVLVGAFSFYFLSIIAAVSVLAM